MADGFKERYEEHMTGRNGGDAISRLCLVVALVLIVLSFFVVGVSPFLYVLCLVLGIASAVYAALRMNSRDVAKRGLENDAFIERFRKLGSRAKGAREASGEARRPRRQAAGADDGRSRARRRAADAQPQPEPAQAAPEKVTVACENCGQRLNVPAGKGNIRITCPKCSNQFTMFT